MGGVCPPRARCSTMRAVPRPCTSSNRRAKMYCSPLCALQRLHCTAQLSNHHRPPKCWRLWKWPQSMLRQWPRLSHVQHCTMPRRSALRCRMYFEKYPSIRRTIAARFLQFPRGTVQNTHVLRCKHQRNALWYSIRRAPEWVVFGLVFAFQNVRAFGFPFPRAFHEFRQFQTVKQLKTPTFDSLQQQFPFVQFHGWEFLHQCIDDGR